MELHKNILTIIKLFCCLLLIGCTPQRKNNQIIINDEKYEVQFQNKSESIKNIDIEQNSNVTVILPRELPIYQWECSSRMNGIELIERKTTTLGESTKQEGETNIADVFVFRVSDKNNHTLEFKKANVNELQDGKKTYDELDEKFKLEIELIYTKK